MKIRYVGITGAAGNIGTTLVKGLGSKYQLKLYDKRVVHNENCDFIKIDFSDSAQLTGKFNGLDALIHLAGNPNPSALEADTLRDNFLSASLVFEEARRAGVKKILFASSNFYHEGDIGACLRGERGAPISLDSNPTPQSMYGRSKLFGEQLGMHMANLGISFAALRIGWTVPQDSPVPYDSPYMRAMFCSKRDLIGAFEAAMISEESYLTAFAVSNNTDLLFDLTESNRKLNYCPVDNSADYF